MQIFQMNDKVANSSSLYAINVTRAGLRVVARDPLRVVARDPLRVVARDPCFERTRKAKTFNGNIAFVWQE